MNFGNRWNEMMFQEHLLILLCSQISTNSDNLHSDKTSRARQCPQVLICHPLWSSWVEFNYPTNLGVALPDVGYWPRHFEWKEGSDAFQRKRGGIVLGAGTLDGRKRGTKQGTWNLWWVPQSQLLLLKPQEPLGICQGHSGNSCLGHPLTSVKHQGPQEIRTSWGTSFCWSTIKTKWPS